jgi:hypothetical protein
MKIGTGIQPHDAIGQNTCGCCRWWHNPKGQEAGVCIAPGRMHTIVIGMAPTSAIHDPTKPQGAVPVTRGLFPIVGPNDGCGDWKTRTKFDA